MFSEVIYNKPQISRHDELQKAVSKFGCFKLKNMAAFIIRDCNSWLRLSGCGKDPTHTHTFDSLFRYLLLSVGTRYCCFSALHGGSSHYKAAATHTRPPALPPLLCSRPDTTPPPQWCYNVLVALIW